MGKRISRSGRRKLTWLALAPFAGMLAGVGDADAAAITWNNAGADFNTAANWGAGTAVPATLDIATFTGAASVQPDVSANVTVSGINFSSATSNGYTLTTANASVITLMSTTNASGNAALSSLNTTLANTISAGLFLGAAAGSNQAFIQAASGTLVLNGVISGGTATNNLIYGNTGTYIINNANTYEGSTQQSSGSLIIIGNKDAFSTGLLRLTGSSQRIQASVDLTGDNKIANAISLGASFTINSGSAIELGGTLNLGGAARTITNSNTAGTILSGVISNDAGGGLIFAGGGTATLTASNTFTGTTAVREGTVVVTSIGNGGNAGNLGQGTTISMGNTSTTGAIRYQGAGESTDRTINLAGTTGGAIFDASSLATGGLTLAGNFLATGAGAKTISLRGDSASLNVISGNLAENSTVNTTGLNKSGTSDWLLTGNNAITGTIVLTTGRLGVGTSLSSGSGNISFTGPNGTAGVGTGEFYATADVVLPNSFSFNAPGSSSYPTVIARFTGEHSITLNGNIAGGGNSGSQSTRIIANSITGGTLTLNGNYASSAGNGSGHRLEFGGPGNTVMNGSISNATGTTTSVTYTGSGELTLAGNSTFSRGTNLAGSGTVNVNNVQALGLGTVTMGGAAINNTSGAAVTLTSGQGINFDDHTTFFKANSTAANNLSFGTSAVNFWSGGTTRALTINGTGTVLSVDGTTAGNDNTHTLTVNGTGSLNLNGTVNIASASTSKTLVINGESNVNVNGVIANGSTVTASVLTYSGTGKLTLNNNNTYGGATNVQGGTVLINGTQGAGAVNVSGGAILGGIGTMGNVAVTAASNSTVSPGNSTGILNTGHFALRDNNLAIELGKAVAAAPPVAGTDYDRVSANGNVTITGANLALSATPSSGLEVGDVFFIIDNLGANNITGTFAKLDGNTADLSNGLTFVAAGGVEFAISYFADAGSSTWQLAGGNDVALRVESIPEPGAMSVIGLVAAGLLSRRRGKKN